MILTRRVSLLRFICESQGSGVIGTGATLVMAVLFDNNQSKLSNKFLTIGKYERRVFENVF